MSGSFYFILPTLEFNKNTYSKVPVRHHQSLFQNL